MALELVRSEVRKSLYLLVTIYSAPSAMGLRASRNDLTCRRYHNPLWPAFLHCSSQLLSPDGLAFPEQHPRESPLLCTLVPLQVGPGSNYPLKYYRCTKWDLSLTVGHRSAACELLRKVACRREQAGPGSSLDHTM